MADDKPVTESTIEPDEDPNYVPPPQKSLEEILQTDQNDESLRKYKEALLGHQGDAVIVDPADPRKVIVKKLALMVAGREDMVLDLSGDVSALKKKPFAIKEGVQYRIRIDFFVQREIVTGLKYMQKISRLGVPVEKMAQMIGSYPPRQEIHSYTSPPEDMPSGVLYRGSYAVSSLFTDDDKNEHLKWEWSFDLKKDWE